MDETKTGYRKYAEEFKLEALELLNSSGKTARQIERDLGITPGLLVKWRDRYQVISKETKLDTVDKTDSKESIFVTSWRYWTGKYTKDNIPHFCGCGCCGFETHQAPQNQNSEVIVTSEFFFATDPSRTRPIQGRYSRTLRRRSSGSCHPRRYPSRSNRQRGNGSRC
jgi:hypothetical protein